MHHEFGHAERGGRDRHEKSAQLNDKLLTNSQATQGCCNATPYAIGTNSNDSNSNKDNNDGDVGNKPQQQQCQQREKAPPTSAAALAKRAEKIPPQATSPTTTPNRTYLQATLEILEHSERDHSPQIRSAESSGDVRQVRLLTCAAQQQRAAAAAAAVKTKYIVTCHMHRHAKLLRCPGLDDWFGMASYCRS